MRCEVQEAAAPAVSRPRELSRREMIALTALSLAGACDGGSSRKATPSPPYDLAVDPEERNNIAWPSPTELHALALRLKKEVRAYERLAENYGPAEWSEPEAEIQEQMESMGYL